MDTPNVYDISRTLRFVFKRKDTLGDPDHKILYTPASLSKLLNYTGFEIIKAGTPGKKLEFLGKKVILIFPPFNWLGSHLCIVAKKTGRKTG